MGVGARRGQPVAEPRERRRSRDRPGVLRQVPRAVAQGAVRPPLEHAPALDRVEPHLPHVDGRGRHQRRHRPARPPAARRPRQPGGGGALPGGVPRAPPGAPEALRHAQPLQPPALDPRPDQGPRRLHGHRSERAAAERLRSRGLGRCRDRDGVREVRRVPRLEVRRPGGPLGAAQRAGGGRRQRLREHPGPVRGQLPARRVLVHGGDPGDGERDHRQRRRRTR